MTTKAAIGFHGRRIQAVCVLSCHFLSRAPARIHRGGGQGGGPAGVIKILGHCLAALGGSEGKEGGDLLGL